MIEGNEYVKIGRTRAGDKLHDNYLPCVREIRQTIGILGHI